MEFKNDDLKVRFTVPDRPTVRQQLEYLGAATSYGGKDLFLAWWRGALSLINEWECEEIPNHLEADFDAMNKLSQANIAAWVGIKVREYVSSLEDVPKN